MCVETPTKHCREWIVNAVYLCLCAKRRGLQRIKCLQHACNTTVLQKHAGVGTGSHAGKASRRSGCRPPSAKAIIFPTARSTLPWNRCTKKEEGKKSILGLTKKEKKKKKGHRCGCISVGSFAALQIWIWRFGCQQERLFIWQLIQSLLCFISPPCHHQLHNFALGQKVPGQAAGTPAAYEVKV